MGRGSRRLQEENQRCFAVGRLSPETPRRQPLADLSGGRGPRLTARSGGVHGVLGSTVADAGAATGTGTANVKGRQDSGRFAGCDLAAKAPARLGYQGNPCRLLGKKRRQLAVLGAATRSIHDFQARC
jgi:hypothetical protein